MERRSIAIEFIHANFNGNAGDQTVVPLLADFAHSYWPSSMSVVECISTSCAATRDIRDVPIPASPRIYVTSQYVGIGHEVTAKPVLLRLLFGELNTNRRPNSSIYAAYPRVMGEAALLAANDSRFITLI